MEAFAFKDVTDDLTTDLHSHMVTPNATIANTKIEPPGIILNRKFREHLPEILNFEVYPDDLWVVSFPKCGTTWTQEMVWLLNNGLDYEAAKTIPLHLRFPFIELESIRDIIVDKEFLGDTIKLTAETPRPRCIKTHLPPALLPKQLWTVKPKGS